ncbi:MAG: sodium-independent anion transporter, partial [Alphaproteobacteria bacterium]
LFIHRMSKTTAVESHRPFVAEDKADDANGGRKPYDEDDASDPDVVVYRIVGAFFFGAAASIGSVLERISDTHKALIIDLAAVPFLDSTAANTIDGLAKKAQRQGVVVILTGVSDSVRGDLAAHGITPPLVAFEPTIDAALTKVRGDGHVANVGD